MIDLYTSATPNGWKASVALEEMEVPYETHAIELGKGTQKEPWFLKINPNGVIPTLIHDGRPLHESGTICEYLDELYPDPPLRPAGAYERALMRNWIRRTDELIGNLIIFNWRHGLAKVAARWTDEELAENLKQIPTKDRQQAWVRAARQPYTETEQDEARGKLVGLLDEMEAALAGSGWLAGDAYSIADIAAVPFVKRIEEEIAPDQVTAIPGNHDAYVRSTRHRFAEDFADFLKGDDGAVTFPSLRRRGPLLLIGLSSALPTPPFMATGTLGSGQLEALERLLTTTSAEPAFRVLLVHHPLRSASKIKRLTDASDLLALLKRHGVDLVLHGHDHVHSTIRIDGPDRAIPVVGVPSASARAHGHYPDAAYNLFSIRRDADSWRCDQAVRGIDEKLRVREIRRTRLI